jgi:oligoribonuclease
MGATKERLIWIDLEMTGLNTQKDRIIEVSLVITDRKLNIIAQMDSIAIHQSHTTLNTMDAWNQKHHGQSGLIERVKQSRINESLAESMCLAFLENHVDRNSSPMCGNSICQDRRFLANYMPKLEAYFHYRHIDVTTIKLLCQYERPKIAKLWKKKTSHEALQDILDSIAELAFYRSHFLKTDKD